MLDINIKHTQFATLSNATITLEDDVAIIFVVAQTPHKT